MPAYFSTRMSRIVAGNIAALNMNADQEGALGAIRDLTIVRPITAASNLNTPSEATWVYVQDDIYGNASAQQTLTRIPGVNADRDDFNNNTSIANDIGIIESYRSTTSGNLTLRVNKSLSFGPWATTQNIIGIAVVSRNTQLADNAQIGEETILWLFGTTYTIPPGAVFNVPSGSLSYTISDPKRQITNNMMGCSAIIPYITAVNRSYAQSSDDPTIFLKYSTGATVATSHAVAWTYSVAGRNGGTSGNNLARFTYPREITEVIATAGTIVSLVIRDTATVYDTNGGNLVVEIPLAAPITVGVGQTFTLPANSISFTMRML